MAKIDPFSTCSISSEQQEPLLVDLILAAQDYKLGSCLKKIFDLRFCSRSHMVTFHMCMLLKPARTAGVTDMFSVLRDLLMEIYPKFSLEELMSQDFR